MDRRNFLKNAASFVTLPILLNGQAINVLASNGITADQTNGKILVLIQLDGGNDGLNTLIPLDMYDNLMKVRPEVVLPENKILPLTDLQGLHPSLTEIKDLYETEKMMFLQNVGYPQPNLSHFRSKEIVLSASGSKEVISSGWFGRYLEMLHPNYPDDYPGPQNPHPLAISIGNSSSPTCQGDMNNLGVVLKSLNTNYQSQSEETEFPDTPYGYELNYITQVMKSTEKYLEVISETAALSASVSPHWPDSNSLADKLKIVARLIAGGLNTPIYVVNLGGFDTHANQVVAGETDTGKHADLMGFLSKAAFAFQDELKLQNREDDVISLVYSEFGRRVASNKSNGTDHGAAYPMMLFGSRVNPTIFGKNPVIPEEVEKGTNVPMEIDFRSVYASILNKWFEVDKTEINNILYADFEILPILKSTATDIEILEREKTNIISVYPNPVKDNAQLHFFSEGGKVSLFIYSLEGHEIKRIFQNKFPRGFHNISFSLNGIPGGQYLLVLQTNSKRVTEKVVVL